MISNLQYLCIYETAINKAIKKSEKLLAYFNFLEKDIEEMHRLAFERLIDCGDFSNITNSIIYAYFYTATDIIKRRFPDKEMDYYINCEDSHLYLGKSGVWEKIS